MRISIRLYRNKDLDIMNFLYNPSKGRFDTSLVRDILKDYTNGRFEPYPVISIEDPNSFPETKLLSVTIRDEDEDIINILKSIQKGMGNIFIKCLIRKYSDISSLQIFRTGIFITKYEPVKNLEKIKEKTKAKKNNSEMELSIEKNQNIEILNSEKIKSSESVDLKELEENFNGDNEDDFWDDLNKMMQIF